MKCENDDCNGAVGDDFIGHLCAGYFESYDMCNRFCTCCPACRQICIDESSEEDLIMTHAELIPIAYRWVIKNRSCGVAFKELYTAGYGEYPDVIGFGSGCHSVLIEVKVSRADFLKDKAKHFRKNPEIGMGKQRFYMCPDGLIRTDELPIGWGLIYVTNGKAKLFFDPYKRPLLHPGFEHNSKAERCIMYSALRRLHIKGHIETIYDKQYNYNSEI